ncbi:hypothetical protein IFO69_15500 [Echinicola sp. CAU 1574]|uniref:Cyclic nucleotide-binding domain-containing protein n=1 Tax=Echinicola arenosa TaxID=2774144 RepID=A0ABR9AQF2_9BACT|nr:hypothetical protein [Echinicola arenosa]MBD8490160.1 hypothetical protein [Echinicola arenosa]
MDHSDFYLKKLYNFLFNEGVDFYNETNEFMEYISLSSGKMMGPYEPMDSPLCIIVKGGIAKYELRGSDYQCTDLCLKKEIAFDHAILNGGGDRKIKLIASEETEVKLISLEKLIELIGKYSAESSYLALLNQFWTAREEKRNTLLYIKPASKRNQVFKSCNPDLVQHFPKKVIAKYLNLHPSSYSRIEGDF